MIYAKDLLDKLKIVMAEYPLPPSRYAQLIGIRELTLRWFLDERTNPSRSTRYKIKRFLDHTNA